MKLIAPDYYNNFSCIADRCRHNCCIGWEIDIDPDTLELYENIPGEFGEYLRCGISKGDTPCFKLDDGERCVFLSESGLCKIILNLGEDALCDICTDHPRFCNFFADRTEVGLGLCCEEACRIILGRTEPMKLILLEDDGEVVSDPDDEVFFTERQRIFDLLHDCSKSLAERFGILCAEYGISANTVSPAEWADFYRSLERLDAKWDKCLDRLAEQTEFAVLEGKVWENLAVYIVYRYSANYSVMDSVTLAIHTAKLLYTVADGDFNEICDACRIWSCEIEYSEENMLSVIERLMA